MWCGRWSASQFLHTATAGALSAWCDLRLAVCARVWRIRTTIMGDTISDKNKKAKRQRVNPLTPVLLTSNFYSHPRLRSPYSHFVRFGRAICWGRDCLVPLVESKKWTPDCSTTFGLEQAMSRPEIGPVLVRHSAQPIASVCRVTATIFWSLLPSWTVCCCIVCTSPPRTSGRDHRRPALVNLYCTIWIRLVKIIYSDRC